MLQVTNIYNRLFLLFLLAVSAIYGCAGLEENSEPASLVIAVKSSEETSITINSLKLWCYACNESGEVLADNPIAFAMSDEASAIAIELPAVSKYCLLAAVANLESAAVDEDTPFSELSATVISSKEEDILSRWKVVDLTSNGELASNVDVQLHMFHTLGKLNVNVSKVSDDMNLYIKNLSVCSAAAPVNGALFSALSPDQINRGGDDDSKWWFNSFIPSVSEYSEEIIQGSTLLFENSEGWRDISTFAADGFNNIPSDCNGYYLAFTYRYTIIPDVNAESEAPGVHEEMKYIPLPPICRGNEYNIKININLGEVYVLGNTEVSDVVTGVW